jgi:hypothetical protein
LLSSKIIQDVFDQRKAMWKYLSLSGSDYCWDKCTREQKEALLSITATKDEAESILGGTTGNIQRFGHINLSSAAAVRICNLISF